MSTNSFRILQIKSKLFYLKIKFCVRIFNKEKCNGELYEKTGSKFSLNGQRNN